MPPQSCDCKKTSPSQNSCCGGSPMEMLPLYKEPEKDEPCCGPPAGPASSPNERPGYLLCSYVLEFMDTPVGRVPRVAAKLNRTDVLGTIQTRIGIGRSDYKVAPGLYAIGRPDENAPVLVTANYKLSFDHLRKTLGKIDTWVLVLDTRGINVWCAAGKGTFGTAELVRRIELVNLAGVVRHRRVIVPQLGATGVSAHEVKKASGFEVVWGPVRAADIPAFLAADCKSEASMRRVTFTLAERIVLVPVELYLIKKMFLWVALAIFILSGIGSHVFSFSVAWHRGVLALWMCITGIIAGAALVPLLLPWIPSRVFALKGAQAGLLLGLPVLIGMAGNVHLTFVSGLSLLFFTTAVSSYLAMNFTGSTPFTSPSGVEKEMRMAIPLQLIGMAAAIGLWVVAGFIG